MTKAFLSFTIEREGRTIQLYANNEGIDKLIEALEKLKRTEHLHLWCTRDVPESGILSENDPWGTPAIREISMTTGAYDDE